MVGCDMFLQEAVHNRMIICWTSYELLIWGVLLVPEFIIGSWQEKAFLMLCYEILNFWLTRIVPSAFLWLAVAEYWQITFWLFLKVYNRVLSWRRPLVCWNFHLTLCAGGLQRKTRICSMRDSCKCFFLMFRIMKCTCLSNSPHCLTST